MSLVNLLRRNIRKTLFTTPSHDRHYFIYPKLRNLYKLDISETEVHNPVAALKKAESAAAEIYGTKVTKFLTNGSTSGIIAAVLSCVNRGEKVLIWDKAHPCHKNAVELAGGVPVLYGLKEVPEWGVHGRTSPDMIELYLIKERPVAVIITSPTYEGYVSNVRALKQICQKYDAYLIVDEAHGALYPFSDRLPESAVTIADFTVQSLHKTAGGVNPTALLHSNTEINIDKALSRINTTSPSYPLLASIEANIRFLNSQRGKKAINKLIDNITELKLDCSDCEFGGDDITKILVKINGISGIELSERLYNQYAIEDEKTNSTSTMLLCGIGTTQAKLLRLKRALKTISKDFK